MLVALCSGNQKRKIIIPLLLLLLYLFLLHIQQRCYQHTVTSPSPRPPYPLPPWDISSFIVVCIYILLPCQILSLLVLVIFVFYPLSLYFSWNRMYIYIYTRVGGVEGPLTTYITFKSWLWSRRRGGGGVERNRKLPASYSTPFLSLSLSLSPYTSAPLSFSFPSLPPPPLNNPLLLLLLAPIMSLLSDFSLTYAPPTFLPLISSLSSVRRH